MRRVAGDDAARGAGGRAAVRMASLGLCRTPRRRATVGVRYRELLTQAARKWVRDKASRIAAAIAFYTILALSPLVMLSVSLAGLVFSGASARAELLAQIEVAVGPAGVDAVAPILEHVGQPGRGVLGTVISVILLALGASGVVGQLQQAFDEVWDVPAREGAGLVVAIKSKAWSMVVALGTGAALLVSLLLSLVSATLDTLVADVSPTLAAALPFFDFAASLVFLSLVFALLLRVLPRAEVAWRDALGPGVATALLFSLGKALLSVYVRFAAVGSAYGAAGSLVVLLLWVYVSGQILLFGAELSAALARLRQPAGA